MEPYRAQATLGEPLENFIALAKRDPERAAEHIKALEDNLVRALDQQRGAVEVVPAGTVPGYVVDLLRQIGKVAGAKATGADARAMAAKARAFVASLDQQGGR